jgi:hypothetical protein
MADLKSRPGSYIGLKTDSIVSAVRATSAEVHLALKELEAEGQIHKTVDDYTWVVSHPPQDLPVLSTNELEQNAKGMTSSDPQDNERRHVQVTNEAEDSDSDVLKRGTIEQDVDLMESDQENASEDTDAPLRKSMAKHIARKVHGYLVKKGGTTLNGALHVEDIAEGVHQTPSEVRIALATLAKQGRAHAPASSLDNWWIATPGNAEQPHDYRSTEAPQASSSDDLQALPPPDTASPNIIIRNPPTFADAPRAPSPTSGPPTDSANLDLSTLNIDEFFSYPSPFGARWTRIDKRLVDPQVLTDAEEEFDDTGDSLVVHRVLRRGEIRRWAEQSAGMRDRAGAIRDGGEERGQGIGRREGEGKGKERERDQPTKPPVEVLRNWLEANFDSPYPDKEQLEILAQQTGRSVRQTRTALSNMRARMTPGKPSCPPSSADDILTSRHQTYDPQRSMPLHLSPTPAPSNAPIKPPRQNGALSRLTKRTSPPSSRKTCKNNNKTSATHRPLPTSTAPLTPTTTSALRSSAASST